MFLSFGNILYSSGGAGSGTYAKDALGNDVIASEWIKKHGPNDRTLTQGLKVGYLSPVFSILHFYCKALLCFMGYKKHVFTYLCH